MAASSAPRAAWSRTPRAISGSSTANPFALTRIRNRQVIEEIPREQGSPRSQHRRRSTGWNLAGTEEWRPRPISRTASWRRFRSTASRRLEWSRVSWLIRMASVIGSTPLGLIGWRDGKAYTMTAAANGLPCDEVHTLLVDDFAALWLYCGLRNHCHPGRSGRGVVEGSRGACELSCVRCARWRAAHVRQFLSQDHPSVRMGDCGLRTPASCR